MTKKDIFIAFAAAIVLGILLGVIIGWAGGFFKKNERLERLASNNKISAQKKDEAEKKKATEEKEKDAEEKEKDAQTTAQEAKDAADKAAQKENKTAIGKGKVATGTGQGLNVRAEADPASTILTTVNDDTELEILEEKNGMYHIRAGSTEGWVVTTYVQATE